MFSRKTKSTIDSLIGSTTRIEGDLHFKGGLRIDGHIRGNVIADTESLSMLVISEQAVIDGEVRAAHLVVNGVINGPCFQPNC
jgi:cytoskeletal protein CcmA (bactofilin family)